jgi:effector-binding domain-containing protein
MKKIVLTLSALIAIVLSWYLFVRSFEFEVKFRATTLPGDVVQTLRIWDRSLTDAGIIEVDSLYSLTQKITWNNRNYKYKWNFEMVNDSTTQINVEIAQPGRSIINKLLIPFTEQPVEQDAREVVETFYRILKAHLKITKVRVVGESELPSLFCVCRSLETRQIEKANGMMKDFGLLTSFISDFNLHVNGPPLIQIRAWNHSSGQLAYDFCFPILKRDSLPSFPSITYQEITAKKALKAVYHGNYITSDRSWYELINFAQANGYQINGLPTELFYHNPNLGMNEETWRAEVYLPIK